jgi:hypothetical protein
MTLASPFKRISSLLLVLLYTSLLSIAAFAQTSGSLTGIVQDPQGNAVANAKVTVADPTKNLQIDASTSSDGTFSFPTLQPGTYQVTVEAQGFKKVVKTGIILNVADRASTGVIQLEIGQIGEVVEVTADAAQQLLKTESGEQSTIITGQQVQGLALNGRNYLDLVKLTPGVVSFVNAQTAGPGGLGGFNINGTRANQHNLTIDGTTNVDTGSNGTQHIALVLDNIAEFKILTSNYQAEYGRSAGGDIKIVTKGGSSEFHGTGYYFHRHEQFNANSYLNKANGRDAAGVERVQRNLYRYNYQGYNVSGPVYFPKKIFGPLGHEEMKEKLFFFWSQEWQEQLLPSAVRQSRVPTALEAAGNFSQTRDGNGNAITIRDPLTGNPFPGNIIPAARLNSNGVNLLRYLNRFENFALASSPNGASFNHNSAASAGYPRKEFSIRFDYNMTENTRMYIRYTRDADQQILPYGLGWTGGNNNIPIDNLIFKQAPAFNGTFNITSTLSSTLTNEFIFGASQNNLTLDPTDPNAATLSGLGLNFQTPFPYPSSQFVNISFGGTPGQSFAAPTGYSQFPYKNSNTTFDFYDNVSKVIGNHTAKAGIYVQRSRKDQAAGNSMSIAFSNDPANPNNTGHPYANALLGSFQTYTQANRPIYQGQYRSTNVEWYIQDNWKVNKRLTVDYGLRFNWIQPQFDARAQTNFFDPSKYDRSKAVRLYQRATDGRAFDPNTPSVLLPAFLVGRIVPGSGDPFNGMQAAASGFERGGFKNRGIQYGPALGFAFDVFGNTKTVLRGGFRIGYDRVSGNNVIFPAAEQPPFLIQPTFNFGNLATVGQSTGGIALGTSNVRGADFEGHIPNVMSYSLQVQQDIGFDTVLSVGYVATLSRHLPEDINYNYIPYGATFTKAAQDPSRYAGGIVPDEEPNLPQVYRDAGLKFTGANALPQDFLRRFPGYGTIQMKTFGGSANYHSLQVTAQRRYKQGLTLGMAYTWSKALGTASDVEGNFINPICSRCYDYRVLSFDRTHTMVINYLYDLPKLKADNWFAKGIVNGWQLTGITQFLSGQPTELGFGIPNININQRISGSWTEGPRPIITGDAQPTIEKTNALDYTQIRMPNINPGPQPRSIVRRPGINVTDLSVFKNIPLGGDSARYIQLRLEMFNVFNHAQFDSINQGLTFEVQGNFSNYTAVQQGGLNSLRNIRGGTLSPGTGRLGLTLGEYSGQPGYVSPNRTMQLAVKIYF